jgi:hypothetical protein
MKSINSSEMNAIVSDSLALIRTITTIYGSDEGMKLWETIADTLGPDVKGKVFFAMLTGSYEDGVVLIDKQYDSNRAECIKLIRLYTGMSLMDSKAAYEKAGDRGAKVSLAVDVKDRAKMISELRQNGMVAS